MEQFLKGPDYFSFDGVDVAQRWARWRKQFETYHLACELSKKPKAVQVAILLNSCGLEAQEIHDQFTFEENEDKDDYELVLKKFDGYCNPRKSTVYERYRFWSRDQAEEEPVDKWVKELRIIAKNCEFKEQEDLLLRDKLVFGVRDPRIKERMLREMDLSLRKATDLIRAAESTKVQMKEMCPQSSAAAATSIDALKSKSGVNQLEKSTDGQSKGLYKPDACYNCGGIGHFSRECPSGDSYPKGRRRARGRGRARRINTRSRGTGRGHRYVHDVETDICESDYQSFPVSDMEFQSLSLHSVSFSMVDSTIQEVRRRYVKFRFHKLLKRLVFVAKLKIDTGAEANLLPLKHYQKLFPENLKKDGMPKDEVIEKSGDRLEAYGGTTITHIGKVNLPCEYNKQKFMCTFFLADVAGPILLGLPSSEALGIVKMSIVDEVHVNEAPMSKNLYIPPDTPISERPPINSKEELKAMYPECFDNVNKTFPDYVYKIKIDPSVKPTVHAARRIPLELKDKVKDELKRMEEGGIIIKVKEPTEWVNSMVVETKENGKLRICLDPTDLNAAIKREYYPVPVLNDIVPKLAGSDVFTKLDAKDGYWHVLLDEESSMLTTFNTPFGRYRYLRMPFGLKMSQDVFQMKIDEIYGNMNGVIGIADDINVHGKGEHQHDSNLHTVMEQSRRFCVSLNYEKTEVKKPAIKFFGNMYSSEGVKPDPDKVSAIQALRHPESKSELRTFLGMVTYLQQFLPNLAEQAALLREMDKKDVLFQWEEHHQRCFEDIKALVANPATLAYYDRTKPVTLQTDFSRRGIGVTLLHEGKPIAYGSKSLSKAESNYATIEGELLSVLFGVKKFHNYLYGRYFNVESDHKPLQHINLKNLHLAPPRLRRMLMQLSEYNFDIKYRPGKEMVLPDTLSRLSADDNYEMPGMNVRIHSTVNITDKRHVELKEETCKDETLQKLTQLVERGWPQSIKKLGKDLKPFWSFRGDISLTDGLLLAGSRIIIPNSARQRVLQSIHEGHQGEMKCKLRAKEAVYWPGIYQDIDKVVGHCSVCKENANAQVKCPMIPLDVPPIPWYTVGADLFYLNGKWYLLVSDYYSKAPFLRRVSGTSSHAVIGAMKGIFSENGIPVTVITDNGTHFISSEFRRFSQNYGFQLVTSSPNYPRGHGFIERQIQTIKKCMRKCYVSGYDVDLALLALRTTPLDAKLPSPAELISGRQYRTSLPAINCRPSADSSVLKRFQEKQEQAAKQYNKHVKEKSKLRPGQHVRTYDVDRRRWDPATVVGMAGTPRSYFVEKVGSGSTLRRNQIHLRKTNEDWNATHMSHSNDHDLINDVMDSVAADTGKVSTNGMVGSSIKSTEPSMPAAPGTHDERRYPVRVRKQTTFYKP